MLQPPEKDNHTVQMTELLDLSRALGTSLHHQLSSVIRDGIVNRHYQSGEALPTEEELCQMFSVSRITVRRAMQSLVEEGLIERRQGRGTFVCPAATATPTFAMSLDALEKKTIEIAMRTRPVVKQHAFVQPPTYVQDALQIGPDSRVLRVVRLRLQDKLPIVQTTVFLPDDIGRKFSAADFAKTPLLKLMQQVGQTYHRVKMDVGAVLADPIIAKALRVTIGSPLLEVKRVAYDASGRPIEFLMWLAPPARHRIRMSFGDTQVSHFDAALID